MRSGCWGIDSITMREGVLETVIRFDYLGSVISVDGELDGELNRSL